MAASGDTPLTPDDIADALTAARERDVAPARLHAQIRAMHAQQSRRPAWRGSGVFAGAFGTAVAAVVALVILIAPGGTPGAPSLAQAVALSTRSPAPNSAPGPDTDHPAKQELNANVGGVYFPNWTGVFGWQAIGKRVDHIKGRRAVTVYYAKDGVTVAYTIVGAPALASPRAPVVVKNGFSLRTLKVGGRLVTTWQRGNSTCVLSSTSATAPVLQKLASW